MRHVIIAVFMTAIGIITTEALALDAVVVGAQVTLTYKEPITNSDGTPLQDLKLTTSYYNVNDGPTVKGAEIPATSGTGGVSRVVTLNIPIVDSKETVLKFWATATDESLNESLPSQVVVKRIDKLAPASPE